MITITEYSSPWQQQVIDLILPIQQQEFHVPITLEDQKDLTNIESFYQNDKGNFWIALNGDKVVGTISLVCFSDSEAALRKMFVQKEFRGKETGTAQRLLDELLQWSKEKNIRTIYLGTLGHMHAAQRFYRRNGFMEIKQEELPKNFPLMHVDSMFFKLNV